MDTWKACTDLGSDQTHSTGFKLLETDSIKIWPDKLDWLTAPTTCSRLQTRHILRQSPLKSLQVCGAAKQLYQHKVSNICFLIWTHFSFNLQRIQTPLKGQVKRQFCIITMLVVHINEQCVFFPSCDLYPNLPIYLSAKVIFWQLQGFY